MTSINELLAELKGSSEVITLAATDYFDFNAKDRAVVIEQGELLVVGKKDPKLAGPVDRYSKMKTLSAWRNPLHRESTNMILSTPICGCVLDSALMRNHA